MTIPAPKPVAPVAPVRHHVVTSPHGERADEYYWLRDDTRKDPEVIGYLEAENAYKAAMLAHVQPLENRLYDEIIARIDEEAEVFKVRLKSPEAHTAFTGFLTRKR